LLIGFSKGQHRKSKSDALPLHEKSYLCKTLLQYCHEEQFMKYLLIFLGLISLILGIAGIFLPILPTTPFLLLSAALFARSSKYLYNRLLNHKILGKYIRGFLDEKAIPLHIKILSISIMWLTILCTIVFAASEKQWLQLLLLATAIAITVHILSYKTANKNKTG
jgi:uncharacterized membrane protein YbaN (DUF454 family)